MAGAAVTATATAEEIAGRIERLPVSAWHTRMRLIIGTAWFFDAFDALAIAFVLPVLVPLWKLAPAQIGLLISAGYAGQVIGSVAAGCTAERFGRTPVLLGTLIIFTVGSFACAFAWSFEAMLAIRFFQGLGLGGEIPIMQAYISEFAKAGQRGRFALLTQLPFPLGIVAASLASTWVVPKLGWQWMFFIGAVPALLAIPLRAMLLESPRWLASRGRLEEADEVMRRIESIVSDSGRRPLPPIPASTRMEKPATTRVGDLFAGIYLRRTLSLWGIWVCSYVIVYGLTGWFPTIMRTVFKLPVAEALRYGLWINLAGLAGTVACAVLADRIGRKPLFAGALLLGSLPLLWLWLSGETRPENVVVLVAVGFGFVSVLALGLGVFTAESYPNHMRALGVGIANAWLRAASMITPLIIGLVLPRAGIGAVWGMFGVAALLGGAVCALFATETRGRALEEISPAEVKTYEKPMLYAAKKRPRT